MIAVEVTHLAPAGWDERSALSSSPELGQTTIWASVGIGSTGSRPAYLTVTDDHQVIGQLLLAHRPLIGGGIGGTTGWNGVPALLGGQEQERFALPALMAAVDGYNLAHFVSAQSPSPVQLSFQSQTGRRRQRLWATYVVDLHQTEERLWLNLNPAARKAVRKARALGVTVRVAAADFWQSYFPLLAASKGEHSPRLRETYTAITERHLPEHFEFLVCFDPAGLPIAGLGLNFFANRVTESGSVNTEAAREAGMPAQDLLHWHALLHAKARGATEFDLAGVAPTPSTPKELGIRRFKEKWGGNYHEYNLTSWDSRHWRAARTIRRAMLNMR